MSDSVENDALTVGCPTCGASSGEPCVDRHSQDMTTFHARRLVLLAVTVIPPGWRHG